MAFAPLIALSLCLAAPEIDGPPGDEIIGAIATHRIAPGESLIELARAYDVGFNEIAAANPRLDAFVPTVGAKAIIPSAWILPAERPPGALVVNLSEMRVYLFRRGAPPLTFPVGVTAPPNATPLGLLKVISKEVAPVWRPTENLRREDPSLPAAVPPGDDNPLGEFALRLSTPTILIPGTNRPFGVGRRVSHGCVRLYPEDMRRLFPLVRVGTTVLVVRERVKAGVLAGRVYVEVHEDGTVERDALDEAEDLLRRRGLYDRVDPEKLARAVRRKNGWPVDVTADRR
jgi:L,D-transpeptidase ErfK/SrfK